MIRRHEVAAHWAKNCWLAGLTLSETVLELAGRGFSLDAQWIARQMWMRMEAGWQLVTIREQNPLDRRGEDA